MDAVILDTPGLDATALRVHSAEGSESLSAPARFTFAVSTDEPDVSGVADRLLGSRVTVRFRPVQGDDAERVLVGDVTSAAVTDKVIASRRVLHVEFQTPDWRLGRRINSRVFQDVSVPRIISVLLSEHHIDHDLRLEASYPNRDYCVQYQETDEAFVARLLGDAGLLYFFADPADAPHGAPSLVLADAAANYARPEPATVLHSLPAGGGSALRSSHAHALFSFLVRKSARPQRVVARRYDEARPQSAFESNARSLSLAALTTVRQGLESVSHADARLRTEVDPDSIYVHRPILIDDHDRRHDAGVMLEQHRRDVLVGVGQSNSDRVMPGHVMRVADHPLADLNAEYAVTKVTHRYELTDDASTYTNHFECVPAATTFRASTVAPRRLNVVETATVVGPEGTRVHTDSIGRVMVRFHWERSTRDSNSSCWVRAIQTWAGTGWGAIFVPRVGSEVAIGFLGGDPDRPVILGGLYSGTCVPPLDLPREALKSGIRSVSVDPATGHVEGGTSHLLFDDEFGNEIVSVRAQRDYREEIGASATTSVGTDRQVAVQGVDQLQVGGDRHVLVSGDTIDDTTKNHSQRIDGASNLHVRGGRTETFEGTVYRESAGVTDVSSSHHTIAAERELTIAVGGIEADASAMFTVNGRMSSFAATAIQQTSDNEIALTVGESSIVITPDRIRLIAKEVAIESSRSTTVRGGGAGIALAGGVDLSGGKVGIFSSGASLILDANASLDGALVRLNCGGASGGVAGIDGEVVELKPLRLQVSRPSGIPMSGWSYVLLSDGVRDQGTADVLGIVETKVPPTATRAILHMQNPEDEADRYSWNIQLGPLPPLTTPAGVRVRLQNLGFYVGATPDEGIDEEDPRLAEAVTSFQRAHDLELTGEVDGPTLMALEAYES